MPFYKVQIRQDAYIYHEGGVIAGNAAEAAALGRAAWDGNKSALEVPLTEVGHDGFDRVECESEDDVQEITEAEFAELVSERETTASPSPAEAHIAALEEFYQRATVGAPWTAVARWKAAIEAAKLALRDVAR